MQDFTASPLQAGDAAWLVRVASSINTKHKTLKPTGKQRALQAGEAASDVRGMYVEPNRDGGGGAKERIQGVEKEVVSLKEEKRSAKDDKEKELERVQTELQALIKAEQIEKERFAKEKYQLEEEIKAGRVAIDADKRLVGISRKP